MRINNTKIMGFTLIEMVVVLVVIGVLMTVGVMAVAKMKNDAGQTACADNLRRIGAAMSQYSADHDGWLLPCNMGAKTNTWCFLLQPYLSPGTNYGAATTVFYCPDDKTPGDNGNASGCKFSYGYNNTAGDSCSWVRGVYTNWASEPGYRPKKVNDVPPETAMVTEIKNKTDWMEWFLSEGNAKEQMLFPHQEGWEANILFIEGNVIAYEKAAMENINQWKIWKRK